MSSEMILYLVGGVILLASLAYLATRPGKFTVEERIFIKAPRTKVFNQVLDFASWAKWSPWAIHEPNLRVKISKNPKQLGGSYFWQGKYIGAGSLTHSKISAPEQIKQELKFLRGANEKTVTAWEAEWKFRDAAKKIGGKRVKGTEVTWLLHGCMPFMFWFMVPIIKRGVAGDYKLGLLLLAQTLDRSADKLKITFKGTKNVKSSYGIYESFSGQMQDLQVKSAQGFNKLRKRIKKEDLRPSGFAFNAYWRADMKRQLANCDFVCPLAASLDDSGEGGKNYPAGKYFRTEYQGSYSHIMHAWNAALSHLRMKKQKINKRLPSLQVYEVSPEKVKSPNDLKTALLIPIK